MRDMLIGNRHSTGERTSNGPWHFTGHEYDDSAQPQMRPRQAKKGTAHQAHWGCVLLNMKGAPNMADDIDFGGRRVLVTGATGFIGSRLCDRLAGLGAETHATSRRPPETTEPVVTWWRADLENPDDCVRVVDEVRPEITFHLASFVSGSRDLSTVLPAFLGNLSTTVGMLAALANTGTTRVVLAGSLEEPDAGGAPVSPYAAAKAGATQYARMFAELYRLPIAVARIFMVYGPGQRDAVKLVPYLHRCFRGGNPPRLSSGVREVDWVFVDDVVDGLIALASSPGIARGESVDLGSGTLVSVREFVEAFARTCKYGGVLGFGLLPDRARERIRVADVASTEELISWRPRTRLEDGLRQTVEWLDGRSEDVVPGTPV